MNVAVIMAGTSLAVALVSGWYAARSRREVERLRVSSEALSRLEVATGALRLELFLETRSFARRIQHYYRESGEGRTLQTRKGADPGAYHDGGMMIYRILRPLTVGEIVEKQTLAGDLLLDPSMADMLRFAQAAVEMLTGDRVGRRFDGEDFFEGFEMAACWDVGDEGPAIYQRVRGSYLRCGAAALLAPESVDGRQAPRCITHAEFCKLWEQPHEQETGPAFHTGLTPMKATLDDFNRQRNPILWLRLVGYAYACEKFYEQMWKAMFGKRFRQRLRHPWRGRSVKFEAIGVPVARMLREVATTEGRDRPLNRYIAANADRYVKRFDEIIGMPL